MSPKVDYVPPHDTGDEASVSRQRQAVLTSQQQLEADVLEVFMTPAGRRLFYRLVFDPQFCGTFDDVADVVGAPLHTLLGAQRVGLRIKDALEAARPGAFCELLQEGLDYKPPLPKSDEES